MRSLRWIVPVLALAAGFAHAQGIFRSVMPDGHIVYGDKPAPGAKESRQVNLPAPNIATPGQTSIPGSEEKQQTAENADAKVRSAQQALEQAKSALENGRQQREGDRMGTKGGSRLTDDYNERIKALEQGVQDAQARYNDAQAQRNATK